MPKTARELAYKAATHDQCARQKPTTPDPDRKSQSPCPPKPLHVTPVAGLALSTISPNAPSANDESYGHAPANREITVDVIELILNTLTRDLCKKEFRDPMIYEGLQGTSQANGTLGGCCPGALAIAIMLNEMAGEELVNGEPRFKIVSVQDDRTAFDRMLEDARNNPAINIKKLEDAVKLMQEDHFFVFDTKTGIGIDPTGGGDLAGPRNPIFQQGDVDGHFRIRAPEQTQERLDLVMQEQRNFAADQNKKYKRAGWDPNQNHASGLIDWHTEIVEKLRQRCGFKAMDPAQIRARIIAVTANANKTAALVLRALPSMRAPGLQYNCG